jgi:hypothetical protein
MKQPVSEEDVSTVLGLGGRVAEVLSSEPTVARRLSVLCLAIAIEMDKMEPIPHGVDRFMFLLDQQIRSLHDAIKKERFK